MSFYIWGGVNKFSYCWQQSYIYNDNENRFQCQWGTLFFSHLFLSGHMYEWRMYEQ